MPISVPNLMQIMQPKAMGVSNRRAAPERDLTDVDFCPLCGVCLPSEERCTSDGFKGTICPHAEAAAAEANL